MAKALTAKQPTCLEWSLQASLCLPSQDMYSDGFWILQVVDTVRARMKRG
jgi:hypothetical protein